MKPKLTPPPKFRRRRHTHWFAPHQNGCGNETGDVHKRFVESPHSANVEWLFEYLNAFDISDRRFANLLEGFASGDVQVDIEHQIAIVAAINASLKACGLELRQTSEVGGYPAFSLVTIHAARSRPKNLIFASSRKPDIRFRDAVNNDIEIASNASDCLVYDKPIGADGLRWKDLQQWWAELTKDSDPQRTKKALYQRLLSCLPKSSPPQRLLFTSFYQAFGSAIPELPALVPEVWLQWDPKTVAQRGANALLNHRMDFLLLLPGGVRVVLEVDGIQHYADGRGHASTYQYSRLTSGDRALKLAGYEVFRFAGAELQGTDTLIFVKDFFITLFARYGITVV